MRKPARLFFGKHQFSIQPDLKNPTAARHQRGFHSLGLFQFSCQTGSLGKKISNLTISDFHLHVFSFSP